MGKKRPGQRKLTEILHQSVRKKRTRNLILLGIILIIVLFFVTGQRGTVQLFRFQQKKNNLEKEIKELETEHKELEETKKLVEDDPEYIEKIAREKYKMKKKEEKVYEVVEE